MLRQVNKIITDDGDVVIQKIALPNGTTIRYQSVLKTEIGNSAKVNCHKTKIGAENFVNKVDRSDWFPAIPLADPNELITG